MKIILFEDYKVLDLEPITLNRPIFNIRYGSGSLLSRIKNYFPNKSISLWVRDSIKKLASEYNPNYKVNQIDEDNIIWLNARVLWNKDLIKKISLEPSKKFSDGENLLAANLDYKQSREWLDGNKKEIRYHPNIDEGTHLQYKIINYLWDFLDLIPKSVHDAYDKNSNIIDYDHVVFNEELGPVIIDNNVKIEPFCSLEGPLYIAKDSLIKSHTKISRSIIGPNCKIGGEVSGTIIQGYSNKSHYGYIGDSFIGEWVNLGAGTTNSNLKNNYKDIVIMVNGRLINSRRLFLGSVIGDHTKTAIGTMLNTGSNIGLGCNIISKSFLRKNIPSFSILNNNKIEKIRFKDFTKIEEKVKSRRNKIFSNEEINYLYYIYQSI